LTPQTVISDATELARSARVTLGGAFVGAVLGLAFAIIATRGLGAQEAGALFVAMNVFTILFTVAQLGAFLGLLRTLSHYLAVGRIRDLRPTLAAGILPIVFVSTIFGAALFVGASDVARTLVPNLPVPTAKFLRTLAPFMPFAALSTTLAFATRGLGTMMPTVAVENGVKPFLRAALAAAAVATGASAVSLGFAVGLPAVIGTIVVSIWLLHILRQVEAQLTPDDPPGRHLRVVAREYWRFTRFSAVSAALQVTLASLDVILVGALGSARDAGLYAAAMRYLSPGALVYGALLFALGPQLSRLMARHEYARCEAVYQVSALWLSMLGLPLYLPIAIFAPLLMRVFGANFAAGGTALSVLALGMAINFATGAAPVLLLMGGKSGWDMANTLTGLVINVVLNVALIPRYGATGAAVAWTVSAAFWNLAPVGQVWALWRLTPLGKGFREMAFIAVGFYGGASFILRSLWGSNIGSFVVSVLLASVGYLILGRTRREQLQIPALRAVVVQAQGPAPAEGRAKPMFGAASKDDRR
jgi:O-antigen/teichoic acid export membrane protein